MNTSGFTSTLLLLGVTACVCVISEGPPYTTDISCTRTTVIEHGAVDEGFSGDVEMLNGVTGHIPTLESYLYDDHLNYLTLTVIGDIAVVHTTEALDAEKLSESGGILYYSVVCDGKTQNIRSLQLNDLNDNGPIFTDKTYNRTIEESRDTDTTILIVEAVDIDVTSENNNVTYSLEPASEDFVLINNELKVKRQLNYNLKNEYSFKITARDRDGKNDTASVEISLIDVDNLDPYFSHNLYEAVIHENEIGPLTILPEAIKAQDGDTGINIALTYSITAVDPEMYRGNFSIDADSGVLSVGAPIDREVLLNTKISVSIEAAQTDDVLKKANSMVLVTVEDENDNPPEFDQPSYSVTLRENSPVDTVLFTAHVTDLDQGGFVGTLQILPESAPFSVAADGTVKVKNSAALDRENTETITFQIQARETDSPYQNTTVEVTVTLQDENDNSPIFTTNHYEGKVDASQTVGMNLLQVQATDLDGGENGLIKYSIDFGNEEGYFTIDENTGNISLAKVIPLVEDRILEFPLYVSATDGGLFPLESSVPVTIYAQMYSKPTFLEAVYNASVVEEQEPGVEILKVTFFANPETPVDLQVRTHADKFKISPTGEITTLVKLDCDNDPSNYSVEITISDGTNIDNATVEVQVTDINDNSPVFAENPATTTVSEDTEVGSSVFKITATDQDSGFNKDIRYFLTGGEGRFSIHGASGIVSVAAGLDRETQPEYNLLVLAEDQGRPSRSATTTLLIQVSDVNDNAPRFSQAEYETDVSETLEIGATLVTLSALDPDDGVNGEVTYSILQQQPSSDPMMFELNPSTGILQLAQPLDYSKVKEYTLEVQASDGGTPAQVANSSVVVRVTDVNNNKPEFSRGSYDVAVSENLGSGSSILTLEVTDKDEGGFSKGFFRYESDTFDISNQGVVSLKNTITLDREKIDSYIFTVEAVDQPEDGLTSTAQVNITVLDFNDNAPQFLTIPDNEMIPEGSYSEETPREVFIIETKDEDDGANGEVTLSILSPDSPFRIREDGMLLAVGSFDRETKETYELLVRAADKGIPQLESNTVIKVSLTDVNDNTPQFSCSSYAGSIVVKDAEEGKLLLTLSATDPDIGDNSRITYSFSAGTSPYLALDGTTGEVTLTSDLSDLKKDTTLELTAMATDHGTPPLTSTVPVVVDLRVASLGENVAFLNSSYNFSILENQEVGSAVGNVQASSGSDLYNVTYALKTHTDVFSLDNNGDIVTKVELDREQQEWYFAEVEAVDTRSPPTTAFTLVKVHVENVNESPVFLQEDYNATVLHIAPYKSPVIQVKALDPDFGDNANLVYSVSGDTSNFDVDPSSGLLHLVSTTGLTSPVEVGVIATDPQGLSAEARVKVVIEESGPIVIIIVIKFPYIVENKFSALERALGEALQGKVTIVQISDLTGSSLESRSTTQTPRTAISFYSEDNEKVIPAAEVKKRLQNLRVPVKEALTKVFEEETDFEVEMEPSQPGSNHIIVIILGVLLGLTTLALIVTVIVHVSSKRKEKRDTDFHKKHVATDIRMQQIKF